MPRKRWSPQTAITPALLKFREKKKWQIALRRYVLQKNPCAEYAPYFGLDIENMRRWFAIQFQEGVDWEDFGKKWQFDHIIPVTYFDFNREEELRMCWNFINLRVEPLQDQKEGGNRLDVLAAKGYFKALYQATEFKPCLNLLEKIEQLELSEYISTEKQQAFIVGNKPYLAMIEHYSSFEFRLLNNGRTIAEVMKEVDFLKKF